MVEYITYQNKKYPIRISYYVLVTAQQESGLSLDELDKNLESQQAILWYALVAGHRFTKEELTLKREDAVWILDECYIEFQKALFKFGQSLVDMQTDLVAEAEGKKKLKM
jgi:hypothetical protein